MSEYSVRRAGPGDRDALAPLFERFYREERFGAEAVARVSETLPRVLARADTAAFVAEADGKSVGAAAMSTSYGLEAGFYAELEDLYVLPEWRGRGVAGALVEAGVDWARAQGCHDVEIVLTPAAQANDLRLDWYAKRGFRDTGRRILERVL